MLIAHLSDLHVMAPEGVDLRRLFNKRLTGYANLRLKRHHSHKLEVLERVFAAVRELRPDHLIISGDLTNLALESEFDAVRGLFDSALGLKPQDVSVVPGNHDVYTRGSVRSRRFQTYFHDYMTSEVDVPESGFPFVRYRGPVAIIGLSSAVPRMPLVAAGELGPAQRARVLELLALPEVKKRLPIIVMHHPPHAPRSAKKAIVESLRDSALFDGVLAHAKRALVVHGHLHRRIRVDLGEQPGERISIGATSASLHHHDAERLAGVNVYEVDDRTSTLSSVYAQVPVEPLTSAAALTTERREIPFGTW